MNSDAVPTITTAWERVIDGEIKRVYDSACDELNKYVQDIIVQRFPLEDKELNDFLKEAKLKSLNILNSLTIANAPPEKLIEMRSTFDEKLEQIADIITLNNYSASEKDCEDLFSNLHAKIKEKLQSNEYQDFKQLGEDWELLRKVYRENAHGPAKNDIAERLGLNMLLSDGD